MDKKEIQDKILDIYIEKLKNTINTLSDNDKEVLMYQRNVLIEISKALDLNTDIIIRMAYDAIKPDEHTHVYCTNCIHGELTLYKLENDCCDINNKDLCEWCPCLGCDCSVPVDSKPFCERPNYRPIIY